MDAITRAVSPCDARRLADPAEPGLADEQAAGEDVGLDEIGIGGITIEQVVADRDELDRGAAAGAERAGDAIHISRPIFLADRLDHLDAGDGVEPVGHVAVIDQADLGAFRKAGAREPALGIGFLLLRQSKTGDVDAIVACRDLGEAAPAAADLEQPLAGRKLEPVEQQPDLALLRGTQRLRIVDGIGEDRAGIGQALVEPGGIEIVPQIVVMGDVAPCAHRRIGAQRVGGAVDPAPRPLGAAGIAQRRGIASEQFEQGDRIGARPFAQFPSLVPADRPRSGEPHQRAPALEVNARRRAVAPPAEDAEAAVRQGHLEPALGKSRVDPVEDAREAAPEQPGDEVAAGGKAPVRRDEMIPPVRGHGKENGVQRRRTQDCRRRGATALTSDTQKIVSLQIAGRAESTAIAPREQACHGIVARRDEPALEAILAGVFGQMPPEGEVPGPSAVVERHGGDQHSRSGWPMARMRGQA